jgi:hypothetical protein
MSSVTKPIMLNETGEQIVQKLAEKIEYRRNMKLNNLIIHLKK